MYRIRNDTLTLLALQKLYLFPIPHTALLHHLKPFLSPINTLLLLYQIDWDNPFSTYYAIVNRSSTHLLFFLLSSNETLHANSP